MNFQKGMEMLRLGKLTEARREFEECSSSICTHMLIEMSSDLYNSMELKDSAKKIGNPDSQYLLATLLSNQFSNVTEYTSTTFSEGVLYMYAASTASHPGALLAMGYRHLHGYGVPKKCETAALNYLEVAKPVANIYANSIPQAVELIRLNVEKDKKILSLSEISLFTEVANTSPEIALAVGKRFLLGTDGFPQDYMQGIKFLQIAADISDDPAAWALLGYVHALGLGVAANQILAEELFNRGIADGLGMNGLGYLNFKQEKFEDAFGLFNQSATAGSADGMFNLASLYLTGTGTSQNFQKAFMWFTEALRRGHTPAGYALAVMHLNGIGTVRDCNIAVSLLKEVAERGEWVASGLRTAHGLMTNSASFELGALQLLKLAEAGHQVSQENLAHLIDYGKFHLGDPKFSHIIAQRFYELAAAQGSVAAELRLGDFAFNGQGLKSELVETDDDDVVVIHSPKASTPQADLYREAIERYVKARDAGAKVAALTGANTPQWLTHILGTAEFNIGYQYHFGLGVRKNLVEAADHYRRSIPANVHGREFWLWLIDFFVAPKVESETTKDLSEAVSEELPIVEAVQTDWIQTARNYRVIIGMLLIWILIILIYLRY